jgi:hypothetical protein
MEPIVIASCRRLSPSKSPRRFSGWYWPFALADFSIDCIARLCLIVAALYFSQYDVDILPVLATTKLWRKWRLDCAANSML